MAGSLASVMFWAVHTTLCSALRLDAEKLPYQAVMVQIDGAAVELFEDLETHAKSVQPPEEGKALSCSSSRLSWSVWTVTVCW
jgi:hypothetical protein